MKIKNGSSLMIKLTLKKFADKTLSRVLRFIRSGAIGAGKN